MSPDLFQPAHDCQTLRPYQEDAVASVLREWETVTATLVVAATGLGKTTIFSEIIRRTGLRALVLAHRNELVQQAAHRLQQFGLTVDVEQAEQRAATGIFGRCQVVVATPQTLFSGSNGHLRMHRFRPSDFGLVIADEVHHYVSPAFLRVLEYFRQHDNLKLLGVTATPDRADNLALSRIFQSVAFNIEILDGIRFGYLVPIRQQLVRIEGLDFSHCRTTAGDLNGADLARVMQAERNLHGVADATLQIAGDKRTLVFTASVEQAEQLCEIFNRHRHGRADWVHGGTPVPLRAQKLTRFYDGGTQILVNCQVLIEGYDNPGIELVVMARPTKSRALYAQMIGRGTRPAPGVVDGLDTDDARRAAIAASAKPDLVVLDFVGNSGRHKLISSTDILGGRISEEAKSLARKRIEEHGTAADVVEELQRAEADVVAELERQKLRMAAEKSHLIGRATFSATYVDPFDVFQRRAEKYQGHVQRRLSEKQRLTLIRHGIDPSRLTLREALAAHWELIRATDKQRAVLYRFYPRADVDRMPRWEAAKCLDALAKRGWRKPQ